MELTNEGLEFFAIGLNALVILIVIPIRTAITKLQESDEKLVSRVQHMEVEMAKEYMRRSEWDRREDALLTAITRIESKLDALDHQKVDK